LHRKPLGRMNNRFPLLPIVSVAVIVAACGTSYDKHENSIIVHLDAEKAVAKTLKISVVSDKIIRVQASPTDTFPGDASLVVLPDLKPSSSWSVSEHDDEVIVKTPSVYAHIALPSGAVSFTDTTGAVILQEAQGGGKHFTPTVVEGLRSYHVRQVFESPADEAFYGLGGHQNGQVNYKGEDVELVQHNIVDVVPFVYSSKNYGLLWDNYSISKFGDPRDYGSLNTLSLYDRQGNPGGLSADYYEGEKIARAVVEDKIEYEYLETPQVDQFSREVAAHGKVVWEGSFSSTVAGAHKFLLYSSGYYKVWIDGRLILDQWRQAWNPWTNKFEVDFQPGKKHTLRLEWIPDGSTYFSLRHLDPFPQADQDRLSLWSEVGDVIDYYFIQGEDADETIRGYRQLTGKAPIVPKWAMGFWQSRERYGNEQQLLDVVREYRKRRIPLDNIVLDWQYWEDPKWGSHEFDKTRFPDPRGLVQTLHDDLHAHFMISVWPKFNIGTSNYEEMNSQGFLFAHNVAKKRKDWVGVGYTSTFYDPFNPEAGKLFWKQIDRSLNTLGVDAWWLDATEPDMHSNLSLEERKINMSPTALGPGAKYFNAYSLLNAKGVYEGQRKSSPDKRVFILTRSAFAGQQRYGAATWSGDIVSRWSDFTNQIATGINFSLSGIPYWTMDIGGFSVEHRYEKAVGADLKEWRELNTRWFQFGAFCPLFRSHGQYPFREIYNIAPEGSVEYSSMVYYDRMRYRLLPYIYSLAAHSYFDDYTIMRGLVMDFAADLIARNVADQYMFGPALLINPVSTYEARSRKVYLPAATGWYDFLTGAYTPGGQRIEAGAPLDRMPIFIREGSIIPTGPELQYSDEKTADPLTFYVFTGKDAVFTYYEDEGTNYGYERGDYARIPLTYNESTHTLTLSTREGTYPGMQEKRTLQVVWISKDRPQGVALETPANAQTLAYEGKEVRLTMPQPVKQPQ
jgi:alpha-D-xyloside xylohydrolase